MQRSKKGAKEPTLAVKDGYLTVDNDLYTLSEGIRDDMKVEEGAKPELVKETASGKKTTAKHSKLAFAGSLPDLDSNSHSCHHSLD